MKMTDQTDHNTGGSNLDKLREIEELCENIRGDISYLNQLESGLTLAASRGADVGAATIGLQEQRASLEQRMNAAQAALDHAFDTAVGELRSVANEVRVVGEAPADLPAIEESPVVTSTTSQICYLDVGLIPWWNFVNWTTSPPSVKQEAFHNYFDSLFAQLKEAGVNEVDLAFAQICDIPSLGGEVTNQSDLFGMYLYQYPEQIKLMIQDGRDKYGFSFNLSLGGANARDTDYAIPSGKGQDYADQLLRTLDEIGISGVDMDVELTTFDTLPGLQDLLDFFAALRAVLGTERAMTLALLASVSDWPDKIVRPLFYDTAGANVFDTMFNGVNLMAYDSGTKYYIYASNPTGAASPGWALQDWVGLVGGASKINLGFQDATPYQDASAWAQPSPELAFPFSLPEGGTTGQCAKAVSDQVQSQLGASLGKPFWWPDESTPRYQPATEGTVDFRTDVMRDFSRA